MHPHLSKASQTQKPETDPRLPQCTNSASPHLPSSQCIQGLTLSSFPAHPCPRT
ncbi:unnamed protein product [Periconia digitata]|uniref:Uncharacterized protein n=1 Tax=Periconia digitata TaxID=1303443 RepID=A0A9W4XH34_9PLEO|nr:unnamed protein product [Periconia digitata]